MSNIKLAHRVALGFSLLMLPLGLSMLTASAAAPAITSLTPAFGPAGGGNQVSLAVTDLPADTPVDVASTAKGGVASALGSYTTNTPDKAFDGNNATNWTGPGGTNYYVQSTFSKANSIQKVAWTNCGSDGAPREAKIQLMQNGSWVDAMTFTAATTTNTGEKILPTAINATAIRIFFNNAGGWVVCSTLSAIKSGYDVSFDGVSATNIQYPNANEVRVTAPAHAAGTVSVAINLDGQPVASLANAYEYLPGPTATSVTPAMGLVAGGDTVTISGSNFRNGATVKFGGVAATGVTYVNATTLTAIAPAHSLGKVDVMITNDDGQTSTLPNGYRYVSPAPSIASITPNAGPQVGGTNVTISGSGFIPPSVTTNSWAATGKSLPNTTYISQTAIVGDKVYMFGGYNGSGSTNAIYSAPLSDPTTWTNTGKTLPSTLYGSQVAVVGSKIYLFGGYNGVASNQSNYSNSIYSANVSDPTTWTNTGKTLPTALSNSALAIVGSKIYLYGGSGTGYSSAILSANVSDPTTWTSAGTLPTSLDSTTVAVIKDRVYLFGGSVSSAPSNLVYSAPISNPVSFTQTGSLPTSSVGNRTIIVGNNIYLYVGTTIYTASITNPNSWTNSGATLPAALNGTSLSVINDKLYAFGGQGTAAIYAASVTQNRPNQYELPWRINWATDPEDLTAVMFDGVPATNVVVTSSTQITATSPAHAPATVPVGVTNYDGQATTQSGGFSYVQAPTITSVAPTVGLTTGGDTVTINGDHFTPSTTVTFGGVSATQVTYVNATTVTATTPAHAVGAVDVVVGNPGTGSATLAAGFTYQLAAPVISSISPAAGRMSGDTTVTLTGSGFTPSTVAYFDGVAATTQGSTATSLTVKTPASTVLKDAVITAKSPTSAQSTASQTYRYSAESFLFTNAPLTLRATQPGTVTLLARDAQNNAVVAPYDTTLSLSSSSNGGSFSVDDGVTWGATSVNLPAGQSSITLKYRDANKGNSTITASSPGSATASQVVTVTSKYSLLVTGVSDPVKGGVPSSVTVQAVDYLGNSQNDYNGTIHFSSDDPYAQLPQNFTVSSAMQSRYTFVNGVTMVSTGERCVTVVDVADSNIAGSQCGISVDQGYAGTAKSLAIITDPQSVSANKSTSAITVQSQDVNGDPAPLPVDTTIYVTSNSGSGSFSADGVSGWTSSQPFAVTIKAQTTSANVYYKDSNNGAPVIAFKDQASGADINLTDASQSVNVGVGPPAHLVIDAPSTAPTNNWQKISVRLTDVANQTATNPTTAQPVYLTSDSTGVLYSASANGSGAANSLATSIPVGANHVDVYINTPTPGTYKATASDSTPPNGNVGLTDIDTMITFSAVSPTPTQITVTSNASAVAGEVVSIRITARDVNGNLAASNQDQTITLQSIQNGGTFSASNTNWQSISSIVLPANTSVIDVYYKTTSAGESKLVFSPAFGAPRPHTITITPEAYSELAFLSGPTSLPVNEPTRYTVGSRDMFGNSVTASANTPVYLYKTSGSGQFSASSTGSPSIANVTIPSGSAVAELYYRDTVLQNTSQIIASDSASYDNPDTGIVNAVRDITTVGQTPSKVQFTTGNQTISAGQRSALIEVQLQKSDGSPAVQGTDQVLYLSSDSTGTKSFTTSPTAGAPSVQTVTVAAGQSSASFYYTDSLAGTHQISVNSNTYNMGASQPIAVQANAVSKLMFKTPPQTVAANQPSAQIQVSATDAYGNIALVTSDMVVTLSSTCASGSYSLSNVTWSPITQITIPAGQASGFVYYKSGESNCDLSATASGVTAATQQFTTYSGPSQLSITGPTYTLEASQRVAYTISLLDAGGNATSALIDTQIYVSATNGSLNAASVEIDAGATSATVYLTAGTMGAASIAARDEANSGAPDTGLQNTSRSLTVIEGAPTKAAFTASSSNSVAGQVLQLTVGLVNQYGAPVRAPADTLLALSTSGSGAYSLGSNSNDPIITSVIVPSGSTTATVYYRQSSIGQATLTASSNSYANGTYNIVVTNDQLSSYHVSGPATLEAGQTGTYTVEGHDRFGNIVTLAPQQRIYLSANQPGAQLGGPDYDATTHSVAVPEESTAVAVSYKNNSVSTDTFTISNEYPASSSSPVQKATIGISIVAGAPAKLGYVAAATPFERGGTSNPIVVAVLNAYGIETTTLAATTVTSTSSIASGEFAPSNAGPWGQSQTVIPAGTSRATVYYRDNATVGQYELTAAANGLASGKQVGTVVSGDPASVGFVTAPQVIATAHPSQAIKATLFNRFGYQTKASAASSLRLTSSSATGEFAVTPPNWGVTTITWPVEASETAFYYRDTVTGTPQISGRFASLPATVQTVTVVPQVFHHLAVTNISTPQQAGTPSSAVVVAQDIDNYTIASYAGTIRFSATDAAATLPAEYTFVPATDKGLHTFVNGIVFRTPGLHTVYATDTANNITGQQSDIRVTGVASPSNPGTAIPSVPGTINNPPSSPTNNSQLQDGSAASVSPISGQRQSNNPANESRRGAPIATGSAGSYDRVKDAVGKRVTSIAQSPIAPYAVPTVIYVLLLLLALFVLASMYREIRNAQILAALLKREQQTTADKAAFLSIASHHVRTPVAIIAGASELLASTAKGDPRTAALSTLSERLKKAANEIVGSISAHTTQAISGVANQPVRPYLKPLFWLPIAATIIATVAINLVIGRVGLQNPSLGAYIFQATAITVIAVVLYVAIRGRQLRRQETAALTSAIAHEQELDAAKDAYIVLIAQRFESVIQELKDHYQHFEVSAPVMTRPLKNGIAQLEKLVDTMRTLSTVSTASLSPTAFKLGAVIGSSASEYAQQLQDKHIDLRVSPSAQDVTLTQDMALFEHVTESIIDNAVRVSPEHATINIDTVSTDTETTLKITDHGGGVQKELTEHELTPFAHDPATDVSEDQRLGLGLYLDALILRRLGGSLKLANVGDGAQVTITIPNRDALTIQ